MKKTLNRKRGFCAAIFGLAVFAGLVALILYLVANNAEKDNTIARLNKKPPVEKKLDEPAPIDEHEMKREETKRMAEDRTEDLYFVAPREGSYADSKPKAKKKDEKPVKKETPKETPKEKAPEPAKKAEAPKAVEENPAPIPVEPPVVYDDSDLVVEKAPDSDVPPPEKVSGRLPEERAPEQPERVADPDKPHYGPGRSPHTGLPLRR